MKEKVSQIATIFSAFTMAACCLGPLILIPLGLTGFAGALAIYSIKYRFMLIVLTLILLIYSFYMVYGRKGRRKSSIIGLWITTFLVLGMFLYMFSVEGYL
ncbi:mercuric transport protein MerT [Pseudobacillus badius]|uniref:mercuric transport protein MerT n=1 Tax=Bacillus badius TaxID=1455 RepID=UPI003D344777